MLASKRGLAPVVVPGREHQRGAIDGSLIVAREGGARIALPAAPAGIDAVSFLPDGRIVATDAQPRRRPGCRPSRLHRNRAPRDRSALT
jgi:hypothetical protein